MIDRPAQVTKVTIKVPFHRELTPEEVKGLQEYLSEEIELYIESELKPGGCWCTGFTHQFDCPKHVITR